MSMPNESHWLKEVRLQSIALQTMLGVLDLDQVLFVILSGITHSEGLGFNRAFLFLADENNRELRTQLAVGSTSEAMGKHFWDQSDKQQVDLGHLHDFYQTSGKDPKSRELAQKLAGFVLPFSATSPPISESDGSVPLQALVARCAAFKTAMVFNQLQVDFQPPPAAGGEVLTFSQLAVVPLVYKNSAIGVLLADNNHTHRQVQEDELRGLSTLANLAAIAIEMDRLRRRLKEMAALDGLTGIFNRRHYELRLEQEVNRAQRAGRSLSLLLLDLDLLSQRNQSFGHEFGDAVLRELATLLHDRVRAEDLVARYGPEEFVVLLTGGATPEEAMRVAEKLRQEVSSRAFGDRKAGEMTVSIGVSWQPPERLDGAALFQEAEKALRQAKQQGRNRVIQAPAKA